MKRFIRMSFIPSSADAGLLVLRVWLGLSIFFLHGLEKLQHFGVTMEKFAQFPRPLAAAAILTEGVMSLLFALGFATRWAALMLVTNMTVAFTAVHHGALKGEHSGELAFLYLAGFFTILVAGPGRFSVDAKL